MVWPVKTHPAHSTGLECKRISSAGEGCSLDFPFYRTDISTRFHREWFRDCDPSIAFQKPICGRVIYRTSPNAVLLAKGLEQCGLCKWLIPAARTMQKETRKWRRQSGN